MTSYSHQPSFESSEHYLIWDLREVVHQFKEDNPELVNHERQNPGFYAEILCKAIGHYIESDVFLLKDLVESYLGYESIGFLDYVTSVVDDWWDELSAYVDETTLRYDYCQIDEVIQITPTAAKVKVSLKNDPV